MMRDETEAASLELKVDLVKRIEDSIVTGSEGFFDERNIRDDLHVVIRIAGDFYDFLVKSGERPPAKEIDYMMGTIRSGMDEFFSLAYLCGTITGSETWSFDRDVHWNFPALRESFLRGFEHLTEASDVSAVDGLASLLSLTRLELVFLAQHFPSATFGDVTDTSQPAGSTGKAGRS